VTFAFGTPFPTARAIRSASTLSSSTFGFTITNGNFTAAELPAVLFGANSGSTRVSVSYGQPDVVQLDSAKAPGGGWFVTSDDRATLAACESDLAGRKRPDATSPGFAGVYWLRRRDWLRPELGTGWTRANRQPIKRDIRADRRVQRRLGN
jgi:hypothetical protein